MTSGGTITRLIAQLQSGDQAAVQPLWDAYFGRLVALARSRLRGTARRAADEEDVALSAFESFCRSAERGKFPRLGDRDDLWQLLYVLTIRKAINLAHHEGRSSRGAGRVLTLSDLAGLDVAGVVGPEPTPALAAQVADECRHLLERLGDEILRRVAVRKMEGYTNAEIAVELRCVEQTVERKLRTIRRIWSSESGVRP